MAQDRFENVFRAVIRLFRSEVCPNVVVVTHTDFGEIAQMPTVILFFPRIVESRTGAENERVVERDERSGRYRARPAPATYDLEFDYEIAAQAPMGVEGLAQLSYRALRCFKERAALSVAEGEDAEASVDYDLVQTMELSRGLASDELMTARGSFAVLGVPVDDTRLTEGPLVERLEIAYQTMGEEEKEIHRSF